MKKIRNYIIISESNMKKYSDYTHAVFNENSSSINEFSPDVWESKKFDKLRHQLIPSYNLLYNSAVEAIAMSIKNDTPRILDLGAGTGLLSAAIYSKLPNAKITLIDISKAMLAKAAQRFDGNDNITLLVGDLTSPLPIGIFDSIVSGLAIHHLSHEQKKNLFFRIRQSLSSNGVFVNIEQVLAPTPEIECMYDIQHEKHVINSCTPLEEWKAGRERMKLDICTDTITQLTWLKEAGFRHVDCLAKDWRFTTYAGWV